MTTTKKSIKFELLLDEPMFGDLVGTFKLIISEDIGFEISEEKKENLMRKLSHWFKCKLCTGDEIREKNVMVLNITDAKEL